MIVKWKTSGNAYIGETRIGLAWKDGGRWRFTPANPGGEMLGLGSWDEELTADSMVDIRDLVQRRATEYASPR